MASSFGVSFGNSCACIAVCRDNKTDVIANDLGDRVTPAIVAFTDHDQAVGLAAKQCLQRNPSSTIQAVKQILGKNIDHPDVAKQMSSGPVKIINKDNKPIYQVMYKERTSTFHPIVIASMIYQKMMETAESHGGIADSHDAVLTVPLDFDEQQRQAVKSAAVKAGFNVLRIISEPAAALLAYDIGQKDSTESCNVLVFRVGGTSLDITIVRVVHGMYHVVASHSDKETGGYLIDKILVDYFASEFQRQSRSDCRGNERSIGKLYNAIENCKHVLSTVPVGQCSVESLFDGIDFNCSLSRSRFEALCGGFISKCLSPLEDLLTKANLSKSDIQKVVACGGCSKIPLLQQQLQDYFPSAELLSSIPPDEVTAVGASIQAAILSGRDDAELQKFADSCEFPCLSSDILVEVTNGADGNEEVEEMVMFKAFTPIPFRRQVQYQLSSGKNSSCLHFLQRSTDGKDTVSLAKIVMTDLAENANLNAVFHIRHDGCLHVTCTEPESGRSEDILVECSSS